MSVAASLTTVGIQLLSVLCEPWKKSAYGMAGPLSSLYMSCHAYLNLQAVQGGTSCHGCTRFCDVIFVPHMNVPNQHLQHIHIHRIHSLPFFVENHGNKKTRKYFIGTSRLHTAFIHTPRTFFLKPPKCSFFKELSNGLFKKTPSLAGYV